MIFVCYFFFFFEKFGPEPGPGNFPGHFVFVLKKELVG